jgi:O-antigen/teichoic acid export membrane protein
MALWGFGAYSFVVPYVGANVGRTLCLWCLAPGPVRLSLHLNRWSVAWQDSRYFLASSACSTIIVWGDYAILGLLSPKSVVGFYYFAFSISVQLALLFGFNFSTVLFPTLSKLTAYRPQQMATFIAGLRLLMFTVTPLCLLQAALAPALLFIFADHWAPAIPIVQVLSIGMPSYVVQMQTAALLQAQGRFKVLSCYSVFVAAVFLMFVIIGTWVGGALGAAVGVSACHIVSATIGLYLIIHPTQVWRLIFETLTLPYILSLVALTPVALAIAEVNTFQKLVYSTMAGLAGLAVYGVFFWWAAPADAINLRKVLLEILGRHRRE